MISVEHIQHLNSQAVTTDGGVMLPLHSEIEYGEIAINYKSDNETIAIKNSNDEIATFSSDTVRERENEVISSAINDLSNRVEDVEKITSMSTSVVGVRGHSEESPTLEYYVGDKEKLQDILSHFKMGWFDGEGKLVYECAKGRISEAVDGTEIPIDGTLLGPNGESCDLMVYTDTDLYVDRAILSGLTVEGSNATEHNIIGLGLNPHQIHGKTAKKFEPFGFTPQVANNKTFNGKQVGYSYYDGGKIQTYVNSLDSSIAALNKGSNYMGLYYEFIEVWWIAMYLELGIMNAFTERLFGCGYGDHIPFFYQWFTKGYAGTSGGMFKDTDGTVNLYTNWMTWSEHRGITFPMMLEAQKILDDVVKYNMVDAVDSGLLMTYESSGNSDSGNSNSGSVIMASDYTATYTDESGETISGSVESPTFDGINFELMEEGKQYFTVHTPQDSNGNPMCQGLKDGVMTAVVNVYYKWTNPNNGRTYIIKDSHIVYRGMSMIEGYYQQLTGLHRVMRKDIEGSTTYNEYQHCRWYYCDSWRQVPRDVSVYQHGNGYDYYSVSGDNADEIAKEYTLPLLEGYNRTEESTPIGHRMEVKECDYDVSLFMSTKGTYSLTIYECGFIWGAPESWGFDSPSNHATITCNAFLVGCHKFDACAGRSCEADHPMHVSTGEYAGGFSHPQIKLK